MYRHKVSTSTIGSLGYCPEQRLLDIEFRNGHVYRYFDVPMFLGQMLAGAESKAAFSTRGFGIISDISGLMKPANNPTRETRRATPGAISHVDLCSPKLK